VRGNVLVKPVACVVAGGCAGSRGVPAITRHAQDREHRDRGWNDAPQDDVLEIHPGPYESCGDERADHRADHVGASLEAVRTSKMRGAYFVRE